LRAVQSGLGNFHGAEAIAFRPGVHKSSMRNTGRGSTKQG
jgi:hypothetical protein